MQVSVVIPTYNGEKYLAEALDSVFAQTVQPNEVIVVDDGSTDKTAKIVSGYGDRIKYIYQQNSGISVARNCGINHARMEYISFLDHDDVYTSDKLQSLLAVAKDGYDVIQGKWRYLFDCTGLGGYKYPKDNPAQYGFYLGACLFKKSCFDKVGLFDESIKFSEDVDLFLRLRNLGLQVKQVDNLCLLYRVHANNTTKSAEFKKENHRDLTRLLYKSIKMKRES